MIKSKYSLRNTPGALNIFKKAMFGEKNTKKQVFEEMLSSLSPVSIAEEKKKNDPNSFEEVSIIC